ncbi:MAG: DUF3575 domain-containing protein [Saprospiraceae bacterium]|nr:DUF3575 domain-containing protein [Saprospiraceae bacterium]
MYKYIYLSLLFLLTVYTAPAQTAIRAGTATVLIIGPYEDWSHFGANISMEKSIKRRLSLGGTIMVGKSPANPAKSDFYQRRLVELCPELRYYFRESMNGLYVGAFAMAGIEDWKNTTQSTGYVNESIYVGPGVSVGYVKKLTEYFDLAFQLTGAAHIGEAYFPVGGALQLGFRF